MGSPLVTVRSAIRFPYTRPVLPRINSGTSGFFFWGMMLEPVQNASLISMKANSGLDQVIAVCDRVHRVCHNLGKTKLTGGPFHVGGKSGACKRRASQRHYVSAG